MDKFGVVVPSYKDQIIRLYSEAHNLVMRNDYARALELLDRIAADVPGLALKTPQINYERAFCLKFLGRIREAEEALHSCLSVRPDDPESLRLFSEIQSIKERGINPSFKSEIKHSQGDKTKNADRNVENTQENFRAAIIDIGLETVSMFLSSNGLGALEVGCMFRENEGLSTYRIAHFIKKFEGQKRFISIEYNSEHIDTSKQMLFDIDTSLLSEVKFLCGHSLEVLPKALEELQSVDFVLLDGGADPECCLREFELVAQRLSENGLVVVDDLQDMAPTQAYPFPRPFGKGTLILPYLVIAEYLKVRDIRRAGNGRSCSRSEGVSHSELIAQSSSNGLFKLLGSLGYEIISRGNHKMLLVGKRPILEAFQSRLKAKRIVRSNEKDKIYEGLNKCYFLPVRRLAL